MQTIKRLLVLLLIAALTVTQLPVTALATGTVESELDNDTFGESSEIIAFDTLPEETANQTVALGSSLEDLDLPNALNATVRVIAEDTEAPEPESDNETVRDSGKPQQEPSDPAADAGNEGEGQPVVDGEQSEHEPEKAPAAPETKEMDISVPVEWVASPEYDSEQADTYTFTAQISGYTLSAEPPDIIVTMGEAVMAAAAPRASAVCIVNEVDYTDSDSAIKTAVADGGTLTLLQNITYNNIIVLGDEYGWNSRELTINLNGYTLTINEAIYIKKSSKLILKGENLGQAELNVISTSNQYPAVNLSHTAEANISNISSTGHYGAWLDYQSVLNVSGNVQAKYTGVLIENSDNKLRVGGNIIVSDANYGINATGNEYQTINYNDILIDGDVRVTGSKYVVGVYSTMNPNTTINGGIYVQGGDGSAAIMMGKYEDAYKQFLGAGTYNPDTGYFDYTYYASNLIHVKGHVLTAEAGIGGTITGGINGPYEGGRVVNLSTTPANNHYTFHNWISTNGGTFTNSNAAFTTFIMPSADTTVTANFTVDNTPPVRKVGVQAIASSSIVYGDTYTLNLSDIFTDADGDTLNYKVSLNGAPAVDISSPYTYTPAKAGTTTHKFLAYDGYGGYTNDSNRYSGTLTTVTKAPSISDLTYELAAKSYNGLAQPVTVTAAPGISGLGEITVKYNGSTTAPKDKGTYAVTVSIAEGTNYAASTTDFELGNYTINKAELTATGIAAKTYDGTTDASGLALTFSGLKNGESLTLNTDYTVTGAQFDSADAGSDKTLSATVALVSNGSMSRNYSLASGNLSLTGRIISKATTTGVPQTVEAVKGYAKNHDFDLTTLLPDVTGALGTVAYTPVITQNDDGVLNTISYTSGSTLPLPVQAVADSGKTAVVTVTIKSDNYNDFTATITVETVEKTPVSISGISMTGGVYNGTPYSYTGTPAFNHSVSGLPVSITAYDVLYTSTDGGGYSGTNAPANAGDYKLMISVSDSDLLYTGSESFGFTIEQRPITVKADDKSMSRGGTLPVFTYKVDGQLSGESALVGIPALASTGDGKAAGSYPITVDLAGVSYHSNYKAATPASVSGTLKVNNSSSGSSSGSGDGSSSGSTQSQSFSTATNNTGIGIDTSGFNLPDGITLVSPHIYGLPTSKTGRAWTLLLTRAPASVGRGGVLGGRSYLALYEFKLLDENGKPVHNIGWTTIRLPIPEGANPDSLMVLYYDEKTRSFTNMGAQVENGYLVFRTPHFSYYMVTGVSENVPAIPETGGGMGVQERLRLLPAAFEKIRHTQRSPLLALSPRRH